MNGEETAPRESSLVAQLAAIAELGKPRVTAMVLLTTLGGLFLARVPLPAPLLVWTLLGTALLVGGANALNMYLERDSDGKMERTRGRPLPSGRLQPELAMRLGLVAGAGGVVMLTFGAQPLAGVIGALAFLIYVWIYTPLKQRTTLALLVGAIPGAAPPLLGHVAAVGHITLAGLAVFGILVFWQIPHFIAISIFREEQYRAAGIHTVPGEIGVRRAQERMFYFTLLLVVVSLQAVRAEVAGRFYLATALVLGGGLVTLSVLGFQRQPRDGVLRWARWYFLYTLIYLPGLFIALMIDPGRAAVMLRRFALGGFAVALVALPTVAWLRLPPSAPPPAPLPVLGVAPALPLTTQAGAPFADGELAGKVWVADFIFTHCPTTCPRLTTAMRTLQARLAAEHLTARTRLVSISVDPVNDPPAALLAFAQRFSADLGHWSFLTGAEDLVENVVLRGFMQDLERADPDAGGEQVIHSARFVLVDGRRRLRGLYDADDQDRLVADIKRLVQ